MIQSVKDIDNWYRSDDPWNYENSLDDQKRTDILIHDQSYEHVLDIGCGHGFITRNLPGKKIVGVDISALAIKQAKKLGKSKNSQTKIQYIQGDLFSLTTQLPNNKFDLIVITGVLYPQYIGHSQNLS